MSIARSLNARGPVLCDDEREPWRYQPECRALLDAAALAESHANELEKFGEAAEAEAAGDDLDADAREVLRAFRGAGGSDYTREWYANTRVKLRSFDAVHSELPGTFTFAGVPVIVKALRAWGCEARERAAAITEPDPLCAKLEAALRTLRKKLAAWSDRQAAREDVADAACCAHETWRTAHLSWCYRRRLSGACTVSCWEGLPGRNDTAEGLLSLAADRSQEINADLDEGLRRWVGEVLKKLTHHAAAGKAAGASTATPASPPAAPPTSLRGERTSERPPNTGLLDGEPRQLGSAQRPLAASLVPQERREDIESAIKHTRAELGTTAHTRSLSASGQQLPSEAAAQVPPARERDSEQCAQLVYLALLAPDGVGSSIRKIAEQARLPKSTVGDALDRMKSGLHGDTMKRVAVTHAELRKAGHHSRSRRRIDEARDELPGEDE